MDRPDTKEAEQSQSLPTEAQSTADQVSKGKEKRVHRNPDVLTRHIARIIEFEIKQVLEPVLKLGEVRVLRAVAGQDHIMLAIRLPFWLPAPSPADVAWLRTRKAQRDLRQGFARHLKQDKFAEEISRLVAVHLTHYLIQKRNPEKFGGGIEMLLRRIAQKILAGRPRPHFNRRLKLLVRKKALTVRQWVENLQRRIEKQTCRQKTESEIEAYLRRQFPPSKSSRMKSFLKLLGKLPRRRYLTKGTADEAIEHDELPPAKLSEPHEWATTKISAKIAQEELFLETGVRFPLTQFEAVLGSGARVRSRSKN